MAHAEKYLKVSTLKVSTLKVPESKFQKHFFAKYSANQADVYHFSSRDRFEYAGL